ncbi:MAG: 2-hydroxyacyl-CoA dehydratase family protein [Dehalococcoidia bacterium]|nr:2-hydroxyacyl-CoA dehydratase family protein [Dehalococcoidia bacterium]MDP7469461.1 2-hydroxyacyl-CoA dehydratase family protein [Dehalococcoidia bacterium]
MKVTVRDDTRYRQLIHGLEHMAEHRRRHPTTKSDALYYQLLAQYFNNALHAGEAGKMVVANTVMTPNELLNAMDMVPLHLEGLAVISVPVLRDSDQMLSMAKSFGLPPEMCSAHRTQIAMSLQGSVPCDVVVTGHHICDGSYKSGETLRQLYDVPGFVLDRPYRYGASDTMYFAQELEDMVGFLESVSGRKLERDRLSKSLMYSRRMMELHKEIYLLRRSIPCPSPNRQGSQLMFIGWLYTGTAEGVEYFETVLAELKERVAIGSGYVTQERLRLLTVFPPPAHNWKLLDWMEREHGAVVAADPYCSHWGDVEWDDSQPFLTLARKWMASPLNRQMHGPTKLGWLPDTLADARDHKVDGAIYWAHMGCTQGCAPIRLIRDALREELDMPTLVLDMDVLDPSVAPEEELKDKLESFFERLEEA